MNATRKNAIKNAVSQDAKTEIAKHELKVDVLKKIINSMRSTDDFNWWMNNAKVTGVELSLTKYYLIARIENDEDFFVSVRMAGSKNEMIAYAIKEINNCLQVIEHNRERLEYVEQISDRLMEHVKNIKKELTGLNELSFEHRLILSIVGLNSKV